MARSRKCFTPEQIKVLEENPYTFRASASGLSITLDAKFLVLELYETGMSSKKIVEALGYDCEMLGEQRVKNIVRHARIQLESPRGLHEGYTRSPAARMGNDEIENLDDSAASYAKLKNEVIYLRSEVKFLKKLSQQAILGKRGE